MSAAPRRYCGRSGDVYRIPDDERCDECGIKGHRVIGEAVCGKFVDCSYRDEETLYRHGHHCERNAGHDGLCFADHRENGI